MVLKTLEAFKINKNEQRKIIAGTTASSQASNTEAPITDPCISRGCIEEEEEVSSSKADS